MPAAGDPPRLPLTPVPQGGAGFATQGLFCTETSGTAHGVHLTGPARCPRLPCGPFLVLAARTTSTPGGAPARAEGSCLSAAGPDRAAVAEEDWEGRPGTCAAPCRRPCHGWSPYPRGPSSGARRCDEPHTYRRRPRCGGPCPLSSPPSSPLQWPLFLWGRQWAFTRSPHRRVAQAGPALRHACTHRPLWAPQLQAAACPSARLPHPGGLSITG